MISDEVMLKVENVSKIYRLGEIGSTTLRDELQRLVAKIRHKPDPTKKVGAKDYNKGEKFKALDNVSFEVKKGERIGIIGHNGAGKSTLLKLISRVTGPTSGRIYMNGRVASMLEVGTGFHPELTGRENIYMNGAILGMTKKEIDAKMEDIIEFSEVRQFIDTPVKRYSSGMYVKLAFSVAAHLDSEIMIMDEVLAVGDMSFQNKCLEKMKQVSEKDERTILYVSHNMATIRKLCDRVIVLDSGKIVYDGSVDVGIDLYLKTNLNSMNTFINFEKTQRVDFLRGKNLLELKSFNLIDKENYIFKLDEKIKFGLTWDSFETIENVSLRIKVNAMNGAPIIAYCLDSFINLKKGTYNKTFEVDLHGLMYGKYSLSFVFSCVLPSGRTQIIEAIMDSVSFEINKGDNDLYWPSFSWGYIKSNNIKIPNN